MAYISERNERAYRTLAHANQVSDIKFWDLRKALLNDIDRFEDPDMDVGERARDLIQAVKNEEITHKIT